MDTANIILTLTDHSVFKQMKTDKLKEKIVLDARGIWREM